MCSVSEDKRITFKRTRPNPLFQDWLEELYEEAKEKNSKVESMLKEALASLSKYPLPLQSGSECAILKGFGKRLCLFLDKRLEIYNSQVDQQTHPSSAKSQGMHISKTNIAGPSNVDKNSESVTPSRIDKSKNCKTYIPSYRSGGYAILIALLEYSKENPNDTAIIKDELIERAQKHSEESFTRPKPQTFYTAWSSMRRLIAKGLVKTKVKSIKSSKTVYLLTKEGYLLANQLLKETENRLSDNDIIFNETLNSKTDVNELEGCEVRVSNCGLISTEHINKKKETGIVEVQTEITKNINLIEMSADSFDIILLIDKNETGGVSKKNDPTVAQFNKYPDLKHEYRSLKVGDFTWIARHKVNTDQELVLPYVVERKRMDDLGASIKDGRFHEQKFRLKRCGLKHVIYMVENYGSNKHVGLPVQSLMQALANTRVQDGFKVHITDSLTSSARFLAIMTRRLIFEYKNKSLKGCNEEPNGERLMTFTFFNKSSVKNRPLSVTETFIKLLLQLKGVSVEKALAITSVYKTPCSLIKAYGECNEEQGTMLLAYLKYINTTRNVGPSVSKTIYQLFSNKDLL